MLINKAQLSLLNTVVKKAAKSELYKYKLANSPKILKNISEFNLLPFTTKKDLRDSYPFGGLATPMKNIIEVHTSSGTTGKATLSFLTKKDLDIANKSIAKAWRCFGVSNKSRVQFMMSYGLFSGAMLNSYAIESIGGFVLPTGIQSAEKNIQMMLDFKIDTIVATPSYYFYLFDYIKEHKISLDEFSLKRGIAAGEIYSDKVRSEIEDRFGIIVYDHYGLCEVNTGIAYECHFKDGLHILDDYVFPEIIDPVTGNVLPIGSEGELVLTSLKKEASPVIRYRTGDITNFKLGRCRCGRSSVRIERIKRRIDDIIFIKGIKIDPYELKESLLEFSRGKIYSDIKIRVSKNLSKINAEILVTLKDKKNLLFLMQLKKFIKNKTLLSFDVINVSRDYFNREENNKVKFVEYVDKK